MSVHLRCPYILFTSVSWESSFFNFFLWSSNNSAKEPFQKFHSFCETVRNVKPFFKKLKNIYTVNTHAYFSSKPCRYVSRQKNVSSRALRFFDDCHVKYNETSGLPPSVTKPMQKFNEQKSLQHFPSLCWVSSFIQAKSSSPTSPAGWYAKRDSANARRELPRWQLLDCSPCRLLIRLFYSPLTCILRVGCIWPN